MPAGFGGDCHQRLSNTPAATASRSQNQCERLSELIDRAVSMQAVPAFREEDVALEAAHQFSVFGQGFSVILLQLDADETDFGITRVLDDHIVHRFP